MELRSGNLQIVGIGKINRKNGRYVAPDLKMPEYIRQYIVCHSEFLIQNKYSFDI